VKRLQDVGLCANLPLATLILSSLSASQLQITLLVVLMEPPMAQVEHMFLYKLLVLHAGNIVGQTFATPSTCAFQFAIVVYNRCQV